MLASKQRRYADKMSKAGGAAYVDHKSVSAALTSSNTTTTMVGAPVGGEDVLEAGHNGMNTVGGMRDSSSAISSLSLETAKGVVVVSGSSSTTASIAPESNGVSSSQVSMGVAAESTTIRRKSKWDR